VSDDIGIDWANLSQEDKAVFFGWLDEFFSAYLGTPVGPLRDAGTVVPSQQLSKPPVCAHYSFRLLRTNRFLLSLLFESPLDQSYEGFLLFIAAMLGPLEAHHIMISRDIVTRNSESND
jgi:hypothetical protein